MTKPSAEQNILNCYTAVTGKQYCTAPMHSLSPNDECMEYVATVFGNMGVDEKHPFSVPETFCIIYNHGLIDEDSKETRFSYHELQEIIKCRGLDPIKLWYLLLVMKDYISTTVEVMQTMTRSELEDVLEGINKVNCSNVDTIRFTIGNMSPITIRRPYAEELLTGIKELMSSFVHYYPEGILDGESGTEHRIVPDTYRALLFDRILEPFLSEFKIPQPVKTGGAADLRFQVGYLFYAVGLTDKEDYTFYYDDEGRRRQAFNGLITNAKSDFEGRTTTNIVYEINVNRFLR